MMLMVGGGGDVPKRAKEKRRTGRKRGGLYSRGMRLCSLNLPTPRLGVEGGVVPSTGDANHRR
jgi:hypothetical protein